MRSRGKKRKKKDRSYNNYLRILLIIYDDDDDDIIYYTFNAYIFVYGQTIKKKRIVASTLAPGSRGEAQFFSYLSWNTRFLRFRQTLYKEVSVALAIRCDATWRMSPSVNMLPRFIESFTVLRPSVVSGNVFNHHKNFKDTSPHKKKTLKIA